MPTKLTDIARLCHQVLSTKKTTETITFHLVYEAIHSAGISSLDKYR